MYFYAEALLSPDAFTTIKRTEWTPEGEQLWNDYIVKKKKNDQTQKPQWKPGKHYTVIEPLNDEYYTFPSEPTKAYEVFRHRWIIVRNRRPHVPILEGSRLPGPSTALEDDAKYCSLFFRPWHLVVNTIEVPYLPNMGFSINNRNDALYRHGCIKRRRLTSKKKEDTPMNWPQTWSEYIDGNVVSKHAVRIIQTFLISTFAGNDNSQSADADDVDDSDADDDIPPLTFTKDDARALLHRTMTDESQPTATLPESRGRKDQHNRTMHISSCLWSSHAVRTASAEAKCTKTGGAWPEANHNQHRLDKAKKTEEAQQQHPFQGPTAPQANLYPATANSCINGWLEEVKRRETIRPNNEQFAILERVACRIKTEMKQEQASYGYSSHPDEEPMLDLIHGLPGTGKSELITWLKELFHLIGWRHNVQYVCLAVQNSMAASIGGNTIHHWAGIPTGQNEGKVGTKDTTIMSIKCQCLRFILIDEISMVSAELLSVLESNVQMVVKSGTLWKRRNDGSNRMFGGINVLFFGDWRQLKLVTGTPLFQSPFGPPGHVQKSLKIFWDEGRDTMQRTW